MPTNKERREVAARLREIETEDFCRCEDYLDALEDAIGCRVGIDYREPTYRLADLVEPEPEPERTCHADDVTHRNCKYSVNRGWCERTCRMTKTGLCSECGEYIVRSYTEAYGLDGQPLKLNLRSWNYCPNCGAKVVED